jgi:hypothetical protein
MDLIELARTIQQDKQRAIEAEHRRRRLLAPDQPTPSIDRRSPSSTIAIQGHRTSAGLPR